MDTIEVRGIRAYGKHGANPHERDFSQAFDIDLSLDVDLTEAATSDDLATTIDYAALHATIITIVREHSYALLERLCAVLLAEIMRDVRIGAATISVAKPRLLAGATPVVRLRRVR